jgi:hypothetical protein
VLPATVVAMLAGACMRELLVRGGSPADWDWLWLSGLATLAVGVLLAQAVPVRLERMLRRLAARGALASDEAERSALVSCLDRRARSWGLWTGLVVSLALVLAFAVADVLVQKWGLAVLEAGLGLLAGQYLGRMAAYGTLGMLLERRGHRLQVQPGHIDRAAGLKPVGDFYFYQAMLTALPAMFLATWWLLIPIWPYAEYRHWSESYLLLLPLAIGLEVLAFLLPMWWFHRQMAEQKARLQEAADALSHQIAVFQRELGTCEDDARRRGLKDRLDSLTRQYWDIEHMPTWPVDLGRWRQFGASNLALATPLIMEYLGPGGIWQYLVKLLQGILESPAA